MSNQTPAIEQKPVDIAAQLTELESLYGMRDIIQMDKQAQRKQVIPDEVQADLDSIEAEFGDKETMLAEKIAALEVFLKEHTIAAGEKLVGAYFYVQYTKGSKQVKVDDVLRVADRFEKTQPEVAAELRSIITMKKPSATIKPKGT